MCQRGFKEGCEERISLPSDTPGQIAAIIEYLYHNDFWPRRNLKLQEDRRPFTLELGDLYVVAEKYRLMGMKTKILQKLEICTVL